METADSFDDDLTLMLGPDVPYYYTDEVLRVDEADLLPLHLWDILLRSIDHLSSNKLGPTLPTLKKPKTIEDLNVIISELEELSAIGANIKEKLAYVLYQLKRRRVRLLMESKLEELRQILFRMLIGSTLNRINDGLPSIFK